MNKRKLLISCDNINNIDNKKHKCTNRTIEKRKLDDDITNLHNNKKTQFMFTLECTIFEHSLHYEDETFNNHHNTSILPLYCPPTLQNICVLNNMRVKDLQFIIGCKKNWPPHYIIIKVNDRVLNRNEFLCDCTNNFTSSVEIYW